MAKRLALLPPPRSSAGALSLNRERKPGRSENRGIADFIDDMLAQERAG